MCVMMISGMFCQRALFSLFIQRLTLERAPAFSFGGEHQIEKLITAIKRGNVRKFYKSKPWRKKRREILRRDNRECQKCKANGGYHEAETVHHVKHLKDRPELALVDSNLISLCFTCHNQEHPEKLKRFKVNKREHITPERW